MLFTSFVTGFGVVTNSCIFPLSNIQVFSYRQRFSKAHMSECITALTIFLFKSVFPTHSQGKIQSIRSSDISADFCCLSKDCYSCNVTVSDGI